MKHAVDAKCYNVSDKLQVTLDLCWRRVSVQASTRWVSLHPIKGNVARDST